MYGFEREVEAEVKVESGVESGIHQPGGDDYEREYRARLQ
jgi:hypothetical protein